MQLYGFTARDCDRLHALLAAYEQGRIRVDVPAFARPTAHQQDSFLGSTSATITAGTTGAATMVDLDTAVPPNETLLSGVPSLPVFNPSASDLPAGVYLFTREPSQGYYCPSFAGSSSSPSVSFASTYSDAVTSLTTTAATISSFSVSLPSAGTYILWAEIWSEVVISTATGVLVTTNGTIYSVTNSAALGDTQTLAGLQIAVANQTAVATTTNFLLPYTATGAETIGFEASVSSTTGASGVINGGTVQRGSRIGYIKLA